MREIIKVAKEAVDNLGLEGRTSEEVAEAVIEALEKAGMCKRDGNAAADDALEVIQ